MRYTVYRTHNKLNGKMYIGAHATVKIHDRYLGSGTKIDIAMKKHGKKNFYKEILFDFETEEEMWDMEELIVDQDIVDNRMYYNVGLGGKGNSKGELSGEKHPMYGKNHTQEVKDKISVYQKGKKFSEERKKNMKGRTPWNKGLKLVNRKRPCN